MNKKIYYYTIESMDGKIYCGTAKLKQAKKICDEFANDGICFKRLVGDRNYKKFAFMW